MLKICFGVYCLLFISVVSSRQPDYYWRDYNGDVPSDAFEAGRDSSGKPIYIGQGYFHNIGLLPGTLHEGSTTLTITAAKNVFSITENIKILCTKHPHSLKWIHVNYADLATLTDFHIVNGGMETGTVVYIGRARHEGDLEIGKIYNLAPYEGLALPNHANSETSYQNFDVLVYDLNLIDVRNNIE